MRFLLLISLLFFIFGCDSTSSSDDDNNQTIIQSRTYGVSLKKEVEIQNFKNITLYKPKVIESNQKIPVVLFLPGWESQDSSSYKSILTFIASQGYLAIYSKCAGEYSASEFIKRFSTALDAEYIDKSNIGVVGHSSGGGLSFRVLDYFSKNGYGENGRFIFAMDPWFAFDMSDDSFQKFPKNTKVVLQQYSNVPKGGDQDPRIAMTIFDKLSVLGDENRDYQVYEDLTHGYPAGGRAYEKLQVVLKPLDALMDYVFYDKQEAFKVSLELGIDNPVENRKQIVSNIYDYYYKCYGELDSLKSALKRDKINYCSIIP